MPTDYSVEICAFLAGKVAKCYHAVNVYQNFTCLEHREAIFFSEWMTCYNPTSSSVTTKVTERHFSWFKQTAFTIDEPPRAGRQTCESHLYDLLAATETHLGWYSLYKIQLYTNHKHHHLFFVFFKYLHINTMYKKFTKQNRFLKRSPSSLFFSSFRKID